MSDCDKRDCHFLHCLCPSDAPRVLYRKKSQIRLKADSDFVLPHLETVC